MSNLTTKQGILPQLLTLAEASDDPADRALAPALRSQIENPGYEVSIRTMIRIGR